MTVGNIRVSVCRQSSTRTAQMRLPRLALCLLLLGGVYADKAGLYPPGLLPLITRANTLLSTGHFNEAAKVYSEAIGMINSSSNIMESKLNCLQDQAPADYLLYYKRATTYFSLQRYSAALEDFDHVLSLTSNTFDNAHLMKARIYAKEGQYEPAKSSLELYVKAKGKNKDQDAEDLEKEIEEGQHLYSKLEKERKSQLWNACVETASALLRKASHSVEVRTWRAECAFAAGDLESCVGDLSYVATDNLLRVYLPTRSQSTVWHIPTVYYPSNSYIPSFLLPIAPFAWRHECPKTMPSL